MPRSGAVKPKLPDPDPIYNSRLVTQLINKIMRQGKKTIAQKHVYAAFARIKSKNKDPLQVLSKAVENVGPTKKVKPRRVGGASYLVPIPVRGKQRQSLALRWIVQAANSRSNSEYKTFENKLAAELLDASEGKGGAVERKNNAHKIAEANKAFAHFRW